jgi:hypothetical protein
VELKVVLVRIEGPGAKVRSENKVYTTLILGIKDLCEIPEEAGTDYKGIIRINDLVVVELKVVLVRIKGPGAKVEVAVLLAPGPVVIRHSLAQNLPMSSVQSSSKVVGRVEKKYKFSRKWFPRKLLAIIYENGSEVDRSWH